MQFLSSHQEKNRLQHFFWENDREKRKQQVEQKNGGMIYTEFLSRTKDMKRINSYDSVCKRAVSNGKSKKIDCIEGNILEKDIAEVMYLPVQKAVIAIIPSTYGGSGFKLIKYDLEKSYADVARRDDVHGGRDTKWFKEKDKSLEENAPEQRKDQYLWFATPSKIDSSYKGGLKLSGSSGDAGCWLKNEFDYNIEDNYIKLTKSCSGCAEEKGECTEY